MLEFSAARRVAGPVVLCVFALVGRVKGLRYCAALAVRRSVPLVAWWASLCEMNSPEPDSGGFDASTGAIEPSNEP